MKDNPYTERLVELVEGFMKSRKLNYPKVASALIRDGKPMTRQGLFKMVKNGSMKVTTLMEILDSQDAELKITDKE